jgi:hypothetical protein
MSLTALRMIKQISILLFFVSLSFGLRAQVMQYRIDGFVQDDKTQKKLDGLKVQVYRNGNEFDELDCGTSGKFKFEMDLGAVYEFHFTRSGYVSKIIQFDLRNIPPEDQSGGFQTSLNLTLFADDDCFNKSITSVPVGRFAFDNQANDVVVDIQYAEQMRKKIKDDQERCKKLKENDQELEAQWKAFVDAGDAKMLEQKWGDAMTSYESALRIHPKPDDRGVQKKYDDAKAKYDAEMAAKQANAAYDKLIADADAKYKANKYAEAKKLYQDASKMKHTGRYPEEKVYEIDQLLANSEKQAQYDALVKEADSRRDSKDYALAIQKYQDASAVLPTVAYPKEQIAICQAALDKLLADTKKEAQTEEAYKEQLALGEKNEKAKNYQAAITNYKEAQRLKPAEKLPPTKIKELEDLIAKLDNEQKELAQANAEKERLAEIERQYNAFIQSADAKFVQENWEASRADYESALGVKPNDQYSVRRIEEVNRLIEESKKKAEIAEADAIARNRQAEIDAEYEKRIQAADALYMKEDYEASITGYESALEIKPEEKYPKSRIDLIRQLIEKKKQDEENEALALKLKQDEDLRKARQDSLDQVLAQTLKEAQELEEQRRLEEEAKRKLADAAPKQEKKRRNSNVDPNHEDDVEKYYREAKALEDAAKYEQVKKKIKDTHDANARAANLDAELLAKATSEVEGQKDVVKMVNSRGESWKYKATAEILRTKENASQKLVADEQKADSRRTENAAQNDKDKEKRQKSSLSHQEQDKDKARVMAETKTLYTEEQKMYQSRSGTLRKDAENEIEREKKLAERESYSGEKQREKKEQELNEIKQQQENKLVDGEKAADSRREMKSVEIAQEKDKMRTAASAGDAPRKDNIGDVEEQQERRKVLALKRSSQADGRRYEARKDAIDQDKGAEKLPDQYLVVPGSETLPEGITEKSYELGNKNITERTVKEGNRVDVYRKCVSKYTIAYFKNGKPITKQTWIEETLSTDEE